MDAIFGAVDARLVIGVIVLAILVIVGLIVFTGWQDRRNPDDHKGPDGPEG